MSVEMACGSCQGRFLVTVAGTVACPHCGTHLIVSAADCPPNVDASALTTVEADEPAAIAPEPAEPAAGMFANYAGLVDAGQPETNESESADVFVSPVTEPADDKSAAGHSGEEQLPPDQERDIVQTHAETDSAPAVDPTSGNGEATAVGDVDGVDSSVPNGQEAATTVPVFSAIETGESNSVSQESPAEFPSFESDMEAPTLTFAAAGQLNEGLGDEELPSAMFEEGVSPFEEGDENRDTLGEFPDFSDAADEDDGNNLDDLLAGASNEATIVENSLEFEAGRQLAQEEFVEPVETTAAVSETLDRGIPRAWFLILASYASAMTIVCLWLLMRMLTGTHQLESLEDPAEAKVRDGKRIVQLYQVDMELPHGHVLRLGESRRFGNILVEPIKVTRGPLNFVYFSNDEVAPTAPPLPTAATLKLWLRLENLSGDQTIAPLDRLMLYNNRVRSEENYEDFRGNTFVCRAADKRKGGDLLFVYDLNTSDSWDLRGQHLEPLAPGGNRVTYIPSSPEGADTLKGNLVWRVHLRKGYSHAKHGVTTLIEINFHSDQIQMEPSTLAKRETAAL